MSKFKSKVGKLRAIVRAVSVTSRKQPVACPASGMLTSLPPPMYTPERRVAGVSVGRLRSEPGALIVGYEGRGGCGERNALGGRA